MKESANEEKDWIGIDDVEPSKPGDPLNPPSEAVLAQQKFAEENPEIASKFNNLLQHARKRKK